MPANQNAYPGHLFTASLLLLVLGIILSILCTVEELAALRYRAEGVEASATVQGGSSQMVMIRAPRMLSLHVTFFRDDKQADSLLGNYVSGKISELLSGRLYKQALRSDSVRVLYLPSDPENRVVLADSIQRKNYPLTSRFEIAGGLLLVGVAGLWLQRRRSRRKHRAE